MKQSTPELTLTSRRLVHLVSILILVLIVWAYYAEVDELVRGQGKVIPSKQLQLVQNLEGGILSELFVEEGQQVKKGEVLLKLDDTQFNSKFQERRQTVMSVKANIARLRSALVNDESITFSSELETVAPDIIEEQRRLFFHLKAQLEASHRLIDLQIKQEIQSLEKAKFEQSQAKRQQVLAEKELAILRPLLTAGVVSEMEMIRTEKEVLKARGEAEGLEFAMPKIKTNIEELKDKQKQLRINFNADTQTELNKYLDQLAQISQTSGALEDRLERTQVKSPVNGTIKQIMHTTEGGVVQPGMDLISIVPLEDSLLIETKVRPSDIARLYPGQKAMVKFTAYDFTVYGGLEAELVHISADSISHEDDESFYLVRVKTYQNNLGTIDKPLPIIPGMVAEVDILTGKKTLLSYLLKPILRAKQVALSEP
jgi:adhesin transport system membrane fusion protein|tara:strand:+ start:703 stop:1983 length:1281 start_codon:yes stop_codon:yes gene_type:complete